MAAVLHTCDECGSTNLNEEEILEEKVGMGGYDDIVRLKCRDCGHEQEGRVLRRKRVPFWVRI